MNKFVLIGELGVAVDMIASWLPARNSEQTHVQLKDGREFLVPIDFYRVSNMILRVDEPQSQQQALFGPPR